MDSRDSSAPPPPHHHHHHHHHLHPYLQQQQQPSHHGVMMIPQSHPQTQHFSLNDSYAPPGSENSVVPTTSVMHHQNAKFPFNAIAAATAVVAPPPQPSNQYSDGSPSVSGGAWLGIEPVKKKRGRPRKYSPDNSIGLGLSPAAGAQVSPAVDHVDSSGNLSSETPVKRNRGRPPGSGKRQMNALGVPGVGFTPHVIIVNPGEDIVSKIMDFSHQGPRTVCILSASGAICNVTLCQTTMSAAVSYEGRYDIISLSGSFPASDTNGTSSNSGGLSISFSGTDGRVLGGGVAGTLKAASPVQIIVGSFIAEGKKQRSTATTSTPQLPHFGGGTMAGASPSSGGGSSDSGTENGDTNPIDHRSHGLFPNLGQPPIQSIPMYPMGYTMKMHPTN